MVVGVIALNYIGEILAIGLVAIIAIVALGLIAVKQVKELLLRKEMLKKYHK
jgi:hypothetical protein